MPSAGQKTTARVPVWLYVLFFLSGISGLMYEVVWVRMLTRILGSTVYATSTVLAAFMAGPAPGGFLRAPLLAPARPPPPWDPGGGVGLGRGRPRAFCRGRPGGS